MNPLHAWYLLLRMQLQMHRDAVPAICMIQLLFAGGLIAGLGFFIPDVTEVQALFLTTGTAAQTVIAMGLVILPQQLAQERAEGRFEYILTLPISREAYLFSYIAFVAVFALPGTVVAVVLGAWHFDLTLSVQPVVILVGGLAVLSLAGVGVALAVLSPFPQLTNMVTQVVIFYALLFAPVLVPKEYLPGLLQETSAFLPPTYVADAMRGALTDLPGTHLARSLLAMAGFAAVSIAISSAVIRRRG